MHIRVKAEPISLVAPERKRDLIVSHKHTDILETCHKNSSINIYITALLRNVAFSFGAFKHTNACRGFVLLYLQPVFTQGSGLPRGDTVHTLLPSPK